MKQRAERNSLSCRDRQDTGVGRTSQTALPGKPVAPAITGNFVPTKGYSMACWPVALAYLAFQVNRFPTAARTLEGFCGLLSAGPSCKLRRKLFALLSQDGVKRRWRAQFACVCIDASLREASTPMCMLISGQIAKTSRDLIDPLGFSHSYLVC